MPAESPVQKPLLGRAEGTGRMLIAEKTAMTYLWYSFFGAVVGWKLRDYAHGFCQTTLCTLFLLDQTEIVLGAGGPSTIIYDAGFKPWPDPEQTP